MAAPHLIAIFGPTGVGKTAVAVAVADRLRAAGEDPIAVSADALQVYRGLETLTGAASAEEQAALEHRLVSIIEPAEEFSAGRYAELAHQEIDNLLAAGRRPIVVGGTGLYLRAALAELSLHPPPAPGVRAELLQRLEQDGLPALYAELDRRAPQAARALAPTDTQRIVRALELLASGVADPTVRQTQLWVQETRHPTVLVGLTMDRDRLYAQINARVEAMVAQGAIDEVRRANAAGAGVSARKAVGFAELLEGDVEGMQRRTRQYARRQLTWMRKLPAVQLFDVTDRSAQDVADAIVATLPAG